MALAQLERGPAFLLVRPVSCLSQGRMSDRDSIAVDDGGVGVKPRTNRVHALSEAKPALAAHKGSITGRKLKIYG